MSSRTLLLALVLGGCAGATAEPAESPDPPGINQIRPAEAASEADATADQAAAPSEEPDHDREAAASASPEDTREILQAVLDDEALQAHLRLEEPGRFPLQVAQRNVPAGIELVKSTEPVKLVSKPKDENDPVLVFTEVVIGPNGASVRYRYDVEGVRGSASLKKLDGRWQLTKSRITQY